MATAEATLPRQITVDLPIADEAHLAAFIERAFGIVVPDVQVCPNHSTPWRAFCEAFFGRAPVSVWKGSRGLAGKTFTLSLLSLVEALLHKCDVNLLGGSGEQSQRALDTMVDFWAYPNAPRQLLRDDPTKREQRIVWGNKLHALMASQASVRGPHPVRLRCDEVDEMDLAILDAALGQPMSKGGVESQVVLSSTHQYADGTMTEILKRAADRAWPVHEWCYKETMAAPHGWLDAAQVARKRHQMTAGSWETEVELQEPSPESRAIMPASVAAMFRRELGVFAGEPRQYVETEAPIPTATYAHGGDWAKKRDWCAFWTLRTDCRPMRFVAFERQGREPWPAMTARFDYQVQRFGGVAAHDGLGVGGVVDDLIEVDATALLMAGRKRAEILSDYIATVERGEIVAPFIVHAEAEHRLASRAIFQADDEHLPDTIAAGAIALWAARNLGYCSEGGY